MTSTKVAQLASTVLRVWRHRGTCDEKHIFGVKEVESQVVTKGRLLIGGHVRGTGKRERDRESTSSEISMRLEIVHHICYDLALKRETSR